MRKLCIINCLIGILLILVSCDYEVYSVEVNFYNNSSDPVGYAVFGHDKDHNSNEIECILPCNYPVQPQDSARFVWTEYKDYGTWENLCKDRNYDTLYVVVTQKFIDFQFLKHCTLPNDSSILHVYKYHEHDSNLKQNKLIVSYSETLSVENP